MIFNLYFIAKLALTLEGSLQLNYWANALLALLVFVPLHTPALRYLRWLITLPAALVLFYSESALPSWPRLVAQAQNVLNFSVEYWLELAGRLVGVSWLLGLVAVVFLCWLNRWLRLKTFVFLAVLLVPVGLRSMQELQVRSSALALQGHQTKTVEFDAEPQFALQKFWQKEALRRVQWGSAVPAKFDVLVLHICSLSSDDLALTQQTNNPLFKRFDVVFDKFNGVSGYSEPAMLRLLRADCGQSPHDALYGVAPVGCGLYRNLQSLGFDVQALINHDGHFEHFGQRLGNELGVAVQTPVTAAGAPVVMHSFDDSPIASDYVLLSNWWQQQKEQRALQGSNGVDLVQRPRALYYNSVSLHDGNRLIGSGNRSLDSYPLRLAQLLADVDRFIDLVASSGRPVLLVFVPEHGAALRSDGSHMAGVRETPLPDITQIPVGVKLIGFGGAVAEQANHQVLHVSQPSSYLTLASLLAQLVQSTDKNMRATLQAALPQLPEVDFVADNGQTVVAAGSQSMWVRTPMGTWQRRELPPTLKIPSP